MHSIGGRNLPRPWRQKACGAKLGNPSKIAAAGVSGRQIQIVAADQFASGLLPIIEAIRRTGATTLEAITRALNERGIRSARGTRWYASSVANLLSRASKLAEVLCRDFTVLYRWEIAA